MDPKETVETKESDLVKPYISIYDTTLRDGAQVSTENVAELLLQNTWDRLIVMHWYLG